MRWIICLLLFTICAGGLVISGSLVLAGTEGDMQQLVNGNTTFAVDVYTVLKEREGNLFFSPCSISSALAMTYAGARGETEAQMRNALHFLLNQDALHPAFTDLSTYFQEIQDTGNVTFYIANALWLQQDFAVLEEFLNILTTHYSAELLQVNFAEAPEEVRVTINTWVEEKTNHKIQNLLPPGVLNTLTRLVLTNAIYFKGSWALEFDKKFTNDGVFWLTPEDEIQTPMMRRQDMFNYGETENVQILQLPYSGEELSMVVLLPKTKDGLPALEAQLSAEQLDAWISETFMRKVNVILPKFTVTSELMLSDTLKTLGMKNAFSDQADFSGIEPEKQLHISEVVHKAFVEINEEGTEAAAATGVVIGVTSVRDPEPVPEFIADHPFLFLIRENQTGSLLFLGRITNPQP